MSKEIHRALPAIELSGRIISRTEMHKTYKVGRSTILVKSLFDDQTDYGALLYTIVKGKMRDHEKA